MRHIIHKIRHHLNKVKSFRLHILFLYLITILIYALVYYYINDDHFNKALTFTDALYFSTTTMSTTGYGDLIPQTATAKYLIITQQLFIIIYAFALIYK